MANEGDIFRPTNVVEMVMQKKHPKRSSPRHQQKQGGQKEHLGSFFCFPFFLKTNPYMVL